jgi:hypothetical protein
MCTKVYRGSEGISLLVFKLSTRWRWMVSLMDEPL